MTHPAVMRKMRNLAIKQALSELSSEPTPNEIDKVAKKHLLSYTELKGALRYGKNDTPIREGVRSKGQKDIGDRHRRERIQID